MLRVMRSEWSRFSLLIVAAMLPLLLMGCIGAGTNGGGAATVNISGTWNLFLGVSSTSVTFLQVNNNLFINGSQTPSGTVSGLHINFSLTDTSGTSTFDGQIAPDASSMSGSFTTAGGAQGSWSATLAPATVTIAGTWKVFHTPNNSTQQGPDTFVFSQTGNTLTGTTSQSAKPVTGTVSGLSVNFTFTAADGSINTYVGTIVAAGNTMSGIYITGNVQAGIWNGSLQSSSSSNIDVTGTWTISQTPSGSSTPTQVGPLILTQNGSSISGSTPQGDVIGGIITGQNINFSWHASADGSSNTYTGNVSTDGLSMSGDYQKSTSAATETGTWVGTKR
ncbi:MAG TPA: hypothetical protein VEI96_09375 [Thermodesulfovibrionales bacterium]|nr:hypothetical protein [Thermodesulfovibrionales bacterium]